MAQTYRTFTSYLKEIFGTRVYRVPLDAGLTCPNRDGKRAFGGCTYCDDRGSGAPTINSALTVQDQLANSITRIQNRFGASKFLAYFQAFSNTYAPEAVLKSLYDIVLEHPQVVGICIGTRPDCVPDNVLDLIEQYSRRTFVWLELGLQSAFDDTLMLTNRGHTAYEFFDAVRRAKARNLPVATHLIFGLPGENRIHNMDTVRQVALCGVDGIKIHQLVVYKGTPMEADYRSGKLTLLDENYYVELVADSLEMLPPHMVIMRLVAEGHKDEIVAPTWSFHKDRVLNKINALLTCRKTQQGSSYTTAHH